MSNQYTSTQWPCGSVVERLPSKQKVPGSSPGGAYFLFGVRPIRFGLKKPLRLDDSRTVTIMYTRTIELIEINIQTLYEPLDAHITHSHVRVFS